MISIGVAQKRQQASEFARSRRCIANERVVRLFSGKSQHDLNCKIEFNLRASLFYLACLQNNARRSGHVELVLMWTGLDGIESYRPTIVTQRQLAF